MTIQLKHKTLFLSLCALTACSDEGVLDNPDTNAGKEPIVLSIGGVDGRAETRAVITDGVGKTLNPFDVNTKIFMVMKSEYDTSNPDFIGARTTKYNVARGDVDITKNDNTNKWSLIDFDSKNQRYWDDAHARSSMLSIYAYAQKGQTNWYNCTYNGIEYKTAADETQPYAWTTTEIVPTILTWRATHQQSTEAQNEQSVMAQDLLFSNNLADNGTGKDKRMKFNFSTRKFPQVGEANMIFYHAMAKITIKIIEGEGFDATSTTDFQFNTTGGNVILKGFNHTGKFDIKQGEFTAIASNGTTDIPSIYLKANTPTAVAPNPHYLLEALVVPSIANNGASRFVKDANSYASNTMMEFIIDNSKYQITSGMLYDALHKQDGSNLVLVDNATEKTDNGNYIPMEAGKNYIFTFEVGKAKIKGVTATVADWEEVTAEKEYPTNARIDLVLEERDKGNVGKPIANPADVYRAADPSENISDTHEAYNWKTGYTAESNNVYKQIDGNWKLETDWFWPDNKHYYHFRAVMPKGTTVTEDETNGDYVTLNAAAEYTDVCWGAPIRDVDKNEVSDDATYKFNYSLKPVTSHGVTGSGFGVYNDTVKGNQLYQAIGPTEDYLKLILFHMMSEVKITMTSNDGADNYVNLGDGSTEENKTTVKIENYYTTGHVQMGNGLVVPSGTKGDSDLPKIYSGAGHNSSTFGVVPQDLTDVQLRITTPDHNEYVVKLTDIKAPEAPSSKNMANPYVKGSDNKYTIDRWYPGFKYHYKLVLSKKQVTILSATILEWETVEASYDNVQIQ